MSLKSTITLTVHRATDQIGGNCIELTTDSGSRIILDVDRPLEAPNDAAGLLPKTLDLVAPATGVLISHPHQDHYGLLHELPAHWPVYAGGAAGELMAVTMGLTGGKLRKDLRSWTSGVPVQVGEFRVIPFLTDHSAFDAYMLLIETRGRRVLYTGDFRTHGRKSALVERLMVNPPRDIDVLLMEGTNLGSTKPVMSEQELENDFVALFRETKGRVYVAWSAQNIDRTVTLYRACKKAGRELIVALYTADVMRLVGEHAQVPQPGWPNLRVLITRRLARMYRRLGRGVFVDEMARHGTSVSSLAARRARTACMIRPSLIDDLTQGGVIPSR